MSLARVSASLRDIGPILQLPAVYGALITQELHGPAAVPIKQHDRHVRDRERGPRGPGARLATDLAIFAASAARPRR